MSGEKHHPNCPARYFVDHPERCRCHPSVRFDVRLLVGLLLVLLSVIVGSVVL